MHTSIDDIYTHLIYCKKYDVEFTYDKYLGVGKNS